MIAFIRRLSLKSILAAYICVIWAATVWFMHFEKHDFLTSLYWAFITGLSIGYGDISPVTAGGRVTAVVLAHLVLLGIIPLIVARLLMHMVEDPDAWTDAEQRELLDFVRSQKMPDIPPYMVQIEMGRAARAEILDQAERYSKGGEMAVQDSWDAAPGRAAWKAYLEHRDTRA